MKNPYITLSNGDKFFDESKAICILLQECILFPAWGDTKILQLVINCNDLFYWGTADAEPLCIYDLEEFYKVSRLKWGVELWCCKQRKQEPQECVKEKMLLDGCTFNFG